MAFKRSIAVLSLFALLSVPGAARADMEIVVVQPLAFGSFMLSNNNAAHTLTLPPQGAPVYAPAMHQTAAAQRGEYRLEGFDPNTDLSVSVNPPSVTLVCGCGGPVFTVDNFDFHPDVPHTDPAGNAVVYVGARVRTDGSRAAYREGQFAGDMQLVVNY